MSKTDVGRSSYGRRMTDAHDTRTAVAEFEITGWDVATAEDEGGEGAALARTVVRKRFSGPLEATSVTELLTAVTSGGRGYVAVERIEGVLDGRAGSFVVQHGGLGDGATATAFGDVVPGSGTGELTGLRGSASYEHDGDTARLTVRYSLG